MSSLKTLLLGSRPVPRRSGAGYGGSSSQLAILSQPFTIVGDPLNTIESMLVLSVCSSGIGCRWMTPRSGILPSAA
jgi:hypothetical protein